MTGGNNFNANLLHPSLSLAGGVIADFPPHLALLVAQVELFIRP